MDDLYTDKILQYVNDSSRVGYIDKADGVGESGLHGKDVGSKLAVRFTLRVHDEFIQKAYFQVFGCGFTIAACAAAAEFCEGRTLKELENLSSGVIHERLDNGLPAERSYCADLACEALRAAIASVRSAARPIQMELPEEPQEEGPRVTKKDPVYKALLAGCVPAISQREIEDRQMFACLLAVASQDAWPVHRALGLKEQDVNRILRTFFPGFDRQIFDLHRSDSFAELPPFNQDVLDLLLSYIAGDATEQERQAGELLGRMIAARASFPGHLWVAMGFFQRAQLSGAIRRHLPLLALANQNNMRWKRFFFKQICDQNGGSMCKTPNCGDCSDYSLCFMTEEEEEEPLYESM